MIPEYEKDPASTLDYGVDWTAWLAKYGPDTIATSTWTVPSGLVVNTTTNDSTTATVWLAGGTVGQRYLVTNHITTAVGRTDERTIRIFVVDS